MGLGGSKVEKALGTEFPPDERFFGFQNFGNTCYCNSVLQALYFCVPFRKAVLDYLHSKQKPSHDGAIAPLPNDNMLTCLANLFDEINSNKKRSGVVSPTQFIQKLRTENELFRSYQHQDAHEFLNFLLNDIAEKIGAEQKLSSDKATTSTFVQECFEGVLVSETKCLCCETVTSREESFLDLSVDVEQHTSVSACLRNFSQTEKLCRQDKFFCDKCCSKQEAEKCMRVKRAPQVLALHLKRFKYMEELQRHKKLCYRVVFPLDLRLCNTSSAATSNADKEYELFAVVVHIGGGPSSGHYVSLVRCHEHWILFDDDNVEVVDETRIQSCFGSSMDAAATDVGYILFYQSKQMDVGTASLMQL
eukprot:TRINITY_DN6166_c0_g1_i1.p1 TRINITY_DN6166_c0_g1~~TRINITY_DN6166_c0_g1_i1.p1  ORF type:complete len:362 (-),score=50.31 TRINITY_DN6166_c0_g1_i1:19-1104(-)